MSEAIILDNVVLSGFYKAGWFETLEFWTPEYDLLVPEPVWENEFRPYTETPEWLELTEFDTTIETEVPGALSFEDWSCIAAAERHSGILVTRDATLKQTAAGRGISTMWSGRFLIDTYEECGISVDEFEVGIEDYLRDAYLSNSVEETIRNAEKS